MTWHHMMVKASQITGNSTVLLNSLPRASNKGSIKNPHYRTFVRIVTDDDQQSGMRVPVFTPWRYAILHVTSIVLRHVSDYIREWHADHVWRRTASYGFDRNPHEHLPTRFCSRMLKQIATMLFISSCNSIHSYETSQHPKAAKHFVSLSYQKYMLKCLGYAIHMLQSYDVLLFG